VRPRRLQTRVLLLLVAVVASALLTTLGLLGVAGREQNARNVARALHTQVVAADAVLAGGDRAAALARLRTLGLDWRVRPPSEGRTGMPLLGRIEAELGRRLPGRALRLDGQPAWLWIRAMPADRGGPGGWVGVPVLGGPEPLRRGAVLSVLAVGTLLLLAAAWFARGLARPLRALARAAPGIVAGEPPPPPMRGASEEVIALHRALADAAERTAAAARDRELLLAGLSHDMRTPLARMRYAIALLEAEDGPGPAAAAARRALEADLERDIGELDAMVGQFIDYVRDGRDEPEQPVDLVALLQAAAADQARQGRAWTLHLPPAAPLRGRPLALRRAIDNLLENAGRHGAGPFEAEVEAAGDDAPAGAAGSPSAAGSASPGERHPGTLWRLSVRDRGPGVPDTALASLGRPFQRVDAARGGPGSGLGLAGVARVAALHGGRLRLGNRPGGGFEAVLDLRG